jgi:alanine racemase
VLIDLAALDHNLATIRGMLRQGARLGAVVKADAYGLGAARIARRMASQVDMLVVFGLDEAEVVHAAAPTTPVLALMPCHEIDAGGPMHGMLLRGLLQLAAHDAGQVARLERVAAELGVRIPLHLEIDTGLGRGGCLPEDATALVARIRASERLELVGAFTHYASAGGSEIATDVQRERFEAWVAQAALPANCLLHSASTFAAIRDARFHHHMVRVGLAWTGLSFEGTRDGRSLTAARTLRPVFSWRSHVMQVRRLPAGSAVGYGSRWVARTPSVVGLVPVGYADGYPLLPMDSRTLRPAQPERRVVRVQYGSEGATGWAEAPVIGAVSMDQIAIDLTSIAGVLPDAGQDALVEIVSGDTSAPNHAARVAAMTGQHAYELLCRIPARVPRRYLAGQEPVVRVAEESIGVARVAS